MLALVAGSLSCWTSTYAPLHDVAAPQTRSRPDTPLISVGTFKDSRLGDHGPDWLGAIRGPMGDPVKKLRTQKPMQEVVEEAFADGLRARGIYAEPGHGRFVIEGTITKLDCSQFFHREAHVHVDVRVIAAETHALVYAKAYQTDKTEGASSGGFFSPAPAAAHARGEVAGRARR